MRFLRALGVAITSFADAFENKTEVDLDDWTATGDYVPTRASLLTENPYADVSESGDYLWDSFDALTPVAIHCSDTDHVIHAFSDTVAVAMTTYATLANDTVAAVGWEVAQLLNHKLQNHVDVSNYADMLVGNRDEDDDRSAYVDEVAAFVDAAVNGDYDGAVNTMISTHKRALVEHDGDIDKSIIEVVYLLGSAMYFCAPEVFRATHILSDDE